MGTVESLVVRAWGLGVRIDARDRGRAEVQARELLDLIEEARRADDALAAARKEEERG